MTFPLSPFSHFILLTDSQSLTSDLHNVISLTFFSFCLFIFSLHGSRWIWEQKTKTPHPWWPLGTRRRRWRSDRHGWGRWHEPLAKGGDRSSWGVLGRVLKRSDLTLPCYCLPHSLRSLTLNCRHHSLIHNSTQAAAHRLFQIESLRHLAFHSNWFGNFLLWFLFFFAFW